MVIWVLHFSFPGSGIRVVHYAPQLHVGETLGGASITIPCQGASAIASGSLALVFSPCIPLLWTSQLFNWVSLHELLHFHHPFHCIHHHFLDTKSS